MSSGNSKFIPLALRLELPSEFEGVTNVLETITASQYGALWTSMSDPVEGNPLVTAFGDGPLPTDPFASGRYLATLSPMYAWDELNTGNFVRLRAFAAAEEVSSPQIDDGWLATNAALMVYNSLGSVLTALISPDTTAPTIGEGTNVVPTAALGYLHTGSTFVRAGAASSGLLASTTSGDQAALATAPGEWTLTHVPGADTIATATRAAGAAGVRHVLRSLNATLVGVAAIAAPISVVVRDGASGAGAILWADQLFAGAAGDKDRVTLTGLNIVGSAATAMTVEFIAAPGATNFEAIAATGYSSATQAS